MATDAQILKSILALRGISAKDFLSNTDLTQQAAYDRGGLFHDDTVYDRRAFHIVTSMLGAQYGEVYFRSKRRVLSYSELEYENDRLKRLVIKQEILIAKQDLLLANFKKMVDRWLGKRH